MDDSIRELLNEIVAVQDAITHTEPQKIGRLRELVADLTGLLDRADALRGVTPSNAP